MSRKSARVVKKITPREMKEIQQAYQELCLRAGQIQYQVKVLNQELDGVNKELLEVNREAALRNEIDKQKSEAPATTEVANA